MATTYDLSTFDPSVIPGGLHRDSKNLIRAAVAFGWTLHVMGMRVRLTSPGNVKSITLSASDNNIPYQRHRTTIEKYANPLLLPGNDEQVKGLAHQVIAAEDYAVSQRKAAEKKAEREEQERREQADREDEYAKSYPQSRRGVSAAETPEPDVEFDVTKIVPDARHVVSEEPMMAHKGQREGYISPTTNVRTWSDGSVDFTCRSEGCDFARDDRHSVGRHWRKHVTDGTEQPAGRPVERYRTPPHEPLYVTGYTPRRERVGALAEVLAALDLKAMTSEELAEFVLNWQHEQSQAGSRVAAEREEMTSDDVLNRIRSLLDNGTYLAQQEEISRLRADMTTMQQTADQCREEARRAKETLATFRELVAEVDA